MNLFQEKKQQAVGILNEKDIDIWLIFVRETSAVNDPVLPFIFGYTLTWTSALVITKTGRAIAILGRHEVETAKRIGIFDQVIGYDDTIRADLLRILDELQPRQIAINTSLNDPAADGLTHGMFQLLSGYLEGTPHAGKLISAESILAALRGRKTSSEIERIKNAIKTTEEIFCRTFQYLRPGQTEKNLAEFMHRQMAEMGVTEAWDYDGCPIINAGPDSPVGHATPTDMPLQRGHLIHFDFGVRQEYYCSDLQRMVYLLRPGEKKPPAEVQKGFEIVTKTIQETKNSLHIGMQGMEADAVARQIITSAGYPEYKYATGHQLGRNAHDGGALLGPQWDRYGKSPEMILEVGQVYTLEPGVAIPGFGYMGLEENILMTAGGAIPLSRFQKELILI